MHGILPFPTPTKQMPQKSETRFYTKVNKPLPVGLHYQKFGAGSMNGTVDHWYSGNKADGWVEYKFLPVLSRDGVDPLKHLSPLQALWVNRRHREGRDVLVIIGSPEGCAILENGAWNARVSVEDFRYSISAVSAFLSERYHDASACTESCCAGD